MLYGKSPLSFGQDNSVKEAIELGKEFPLIDLDVFREDQSILGLIKDMSHPDKDLRDEDFLVLVMKYFPYYLLGEVIDDRKSSLIETSIIFHHVHGFWDLIRDSKEGRPHPMQDFGKCELYIAEQLRLRHYATAMLGDIASSAALIKDIINRNIDDDVDRESFLGLDLGTGSGILGLAQYILAKRNGFEGINIYGIEHSEQVAAVTQKVLGSVMTVLPGDTTEPFLYDALKDLHQNKDLTFLSSENIPSPRIPMSDEEPFIQNFQQMLAREIKIPAQVFPSGVELSMGFEQEDGEVEIKSNLVEDCGLIDWGKVEPELMPYLTIDRLLINGEWSDQRTLPETIEGASKIPVFDRWYRRWGAPQGDRIMPGEISA